MWKFENAGLRVSKYLDKNHVVVKISREKVSISGGGKAIIFKLEASKMVA